jgi:hypothetical protein
MSEHEAHADKTGKSPLSHFEIGAIGKKRMEELGEFQSGLFEWLQEANRTWFGLIQSEAALTSEFTAKLTAARSIPETTTIYQEWASRRMKLATENANHLLAGRREADGDGNASVVEQRANQRSRPRQHLMRWRSHGDMARLHYMTG